jgi:hypothetical protein
MYKDYSRIGLPVDDEALEAMIQAAAETADTVARTKGATRQQLAGREEMALKMLRSNLPLREQQRIWEQAGIRTTAPSLRAFFKRYYPGEWAAYLSRTARGQLKNRLLEEPVGAEKEEIEKFLKVSAKVDTSETDKPEARTANELTPLSDDDSLRDALTAAAKPRFNQTPGDKK